MADIFISYTSSDREWAFWIAKELEGLGHVPHVYEWEVKGGDDIYAWMQQRHDAADHVLCVVSDEYLKAPYSTLERNAALWQMASKRPGFVLLVAVKPCRLPTLSDHIRRCELFGVPEGSARIRFREFMSAPVAPTVIAFPGRVFAASNIPIRVPAHFMGRDDALAAIEMALHRYQGRVAITALHGLRGVGKTTLAATYADRHRSEYRATWWIRAQTEAGLRSDLVGLGVRLGWVATDDTEEQALTAVMHRLRHEGEGILLIYDNAIDANALKSYLPPSGSAQVLVTSNAPAWRGLAEPVEIRLWPKEIGADYLIARTGRVPERASALELSELLGGLPLAHEQAAAYCERVGISMIEYRNRFDTTPARLLDDERDAPAEYHDRRTVAKTFALAIKEATKVHPAAELLMAQLALFAPEPIPLFLLAEARAIFRHPLASALAGDGLNEVVATLRAFALVDRETITDDWQPSITTDTIRLHRLVRQIAATPYKGRSLEVARRKCLRAVATVYPKDLYDHRSWPRARRLNTLALAVVDNDFRPKNRTPATTVLAKVKAIILTPYRRGWLGWLLGLSIGILLIPLEDPWRVAITVAFCLIIYADILCVWIVRRVTSVTIDLPIHTEWLRAYLLQLLAEYQEEAVCNYAQARSLYQKALAIYERTFGSDGAVLCLINLGQLLEAQGDLSGARSLLERAVAICEKVYDFDDWSTARSISKLADVIQEQDDPEGMQSLFQRATAQHKSWLVTLIGKISPKRNVSMTLEHLVSLV